MDGAGKGRNSVFAKQKARYETGPMMSEKRFSAVTSIAGVRASCAEIWLFDTVVFRLKAFEVSEANDRLSGEWSGTSICPQQIRQP